MWWCNGEEGSHQVARHTQATENISELEQNVSKPDALHQLLREEIIAQFSNIGPPSKGDFIVILY